jgi:hypothetical protein
MIVFVGVAVELSGWFFIAGINGCGLLHSSILENIKYVNSHYQFLKNDWVPFVLLPFIFIDIFINNFYSQLPEKPLLGGRMPAGIW